MTKKDVCSAFRVRLHFPQLSQEVAGHAEKDPSRPRWRIPAPSSCSSPPLPQLQLPALVWPRQSLTAPSEPHGEPVTDVEDMRLAWIYSYLTIKKKWVCKVTKSASSWLSSWTEAEMFKSIKEKTHMWYLILERSHENTCHKFTHHKIGNLKYDEIWLKNEKKWKVCYDSH